MAAIVSYRHKGLLRFFETGDTRNIQPHHQRKLRIILNVLQQMKTLPDLQSSKLGSHKLSGEFKGFGAVEVSGNWRVIFRFDETRCEVSDVDYLDYH